MSHKIMSYTLVSFEECKEGLTDKYSSDTASLVQYGLRSYGLQSEFDIANRLQQLRLIALSLVEHLEELGVEIPDKVLNTIDVEKEISTTRRFCLDRNK